MDPHSPIFDLAAAMSRDKLAEYDDLRLGLENNQMQPQPGAEFARRSREHLQDFNSEAREALRTIIAARDLAPDEPIPTPLEAAIFAARKVL